MVQQMFRGGVAKGGEGLTGLFNHLVGLYTSYELQ